MSEEQKKAGTRTGTWSDLMGKDLRMKVTQAADAGDDAQTCDPGDAVRVDFTGYRAKDTTGEDWKTQDDIFHEAKDWLVVIVDKDVCPALEMGIRFMREGETAIIQSHAKYAYGPAERTHQDYVLPPHSDVVYKVRVKAIVKGESETFSSPEFMIQCALSKKEIGNDCYKNEWSGGFGMSKALQLYRKSADTVKRMPLDDLNAQDKQQAFEILLDCLNNIAATHMRAKEYGKAKEAATQVLVQDNRNYKGLCRAARAAMLDPAGTYEEANAAIVAAEKEYGDDDDIRKLRLELKRRKKDYNKKSKAMFSKMAGAMKPETDEAAGSGDAVEPSSEIHEAPTDDENLSWFEKNKRKLLYHAIILILQIIAAFHLRSKLPKPEAPEPTETVEDQSIQTEF